MFFKRLVDWKNDEVEVDIIPKTNEKYITVTYACIRFIDSYRFLSSSLDSLVKTSVDYSHKTLKIWKKKLLLLMKEIEDDRTIEDFKKGYPDKFENLEETLLSYMGENDLKILKTEFPDNRWKYLTKKLAYPYECFNSLDDYQKPIHNLQKEDFFSKLKIKRPDDEETQKTNKFIKLFSFKYGEELTQLYLKSDVLLLACVFEKLIEVSLNEIDINTLFCASLPGYIWQWLLKYTGINLQPLQEKGLILTLENNIRGGISSVMDDRHKKSDENKKIIYMDATNLYGHSLIQPLPFDESEMWHGHPDFYMNKEEKILNTPDDSDIGYFLEVDLKHPDEIKEKTKNFQFCQKKR